MNGSSSGAGPRRAGLRAGERVERVRVLDVLLRAGGRVRVDEAGTRRH
jgi:hypothetical protein